jgi:hypothetical protein
MHRILQVSLAALLVVILSSYGFLQPAAAQPDGKTTTLEIGIGAALLGNLVKLSVDNGKANRNGDDAMHLIEAPSPDTVRFPNAQPGSALPDRAMPSARGLRAQILAAVKAGNAPATRDQYEVLRTCWNSVILPPPPDAGADKNPAAAPAKVDCTKLPGDVAAVVNTVVDPYDASVAFATAPSMYQQIIDLQVGSHTTENVLRVHMLYVLGELYLGYRPKLPPGTPAAALDAKGVLTSCFLKPDLFDCAGKIGDAEASAAADHRTAVACGFARLAWLPTYSAIKMQPGPIDENTNFGAARGCR